MMYMPRCSSSIVVLLSTLSLFASAYEKPGAGDVEPLSYAAGDRISVSCLNRTIDTGEHVFDVETGKFQYVPFATCNETSRPLELSFLEDGLLNCTIPFLSDETFHLLEYYVHHDSPLTCRVPARPLGGDRDLKTSPDDEYIPLVFVLAGKLETSHMHLATDMNLLLHLSATSPGAIDSAVAYSTSMHASATRVIIGDALPLRLRVRWHPSPSPFEEAERAAGHATMYYCVVSALAGAAVTYAALQRWEVSRRLRRYAFDRRHGAGNASGGIIGNFPMVGNVRNGGGAGGGGGGGGYGYSPPTGRNGEVPANGYAGYGYSGKRKD